jgi:hypothetical protein
MCKCGKKIFQSHWKKKKNKTAISGVVTKKQFTGWLQQAGWVLDGNFLVP